MATNSLIEIRVGAPGSVLAIDIGPVSVDVPRSAGYFGGLAIAVGAGLIEPPLALFIAAVPIFKILTNSALPLPIRTVGELLEGAAKPVGSDAEGVVALEDEQRTEPKVIKLEPKGHSAPAPSQAGT
ncbi:hypothetical protein LWP59_13545 [Amycolatopsis acidiphila]|uniref:Uncharacterized protein n=1 Tax=Amycolatopsis acidiphila TaxID=715473 RepID=A0A558AJ49_9PSEU|nr:hypothetical protein [Amycolatopsis acidiphila]TVT24290.1 hypothetical protein FNH06_06910 [Amycolatopsis acidiphila]UIJ62576.1 hypothetical protein LWP59_13545 [Amycolatopsis acidiphila]GHG85525.1 hypothetical protein GCM10017788_58240 [Amycolatopsis acidiphila]